MRKVKHLFRQSRGAALIETALTVLLLMILVIGIGAVNIQISAIENAGRGLSEVSETAAQMMDEDSGLTLGNQEILLDMARARTQAPEEDVLLRIHHVQRSSFTGEYVILNTYDIGDLVRNPIVSIGGLLDPVPGISLLGETISLDLGDEVMVVYFATVYRGVPRGIREPQIYEQVNVVPF